MLDAVHARNLKTTESGSRQKISDAEQARLEVRLDLYQVLIEEYLAQHPGMPYPQELKKAEDGCKTEFQNVRDEDERHKKINSKMVAEFYKWLHRNKVERSALCFSGGGIRSATFGLGILQGLAKRGLLDQFDYLSTVSGGGYLGGWLSAWIHRKGIKKVQERLKNAFPPSPLEPEPDAIQHLRSYSNYMSPKLGLLSADTWTLVAIFLRNLLLNWLVLFPFILLVLMIPRLSMVAVRATPENRLSPGQLQAPLPAQLKSILLWLAPNAPLGGSGLFWGAVICGIISIIYIYLNRPSMADQQLRDTDKPYNVFWNKHKSQGWFLRLCLTPLLLLAVFITTYYAWLGRSIEQVTFPGFGNWIVNNLHTDKIRIGQSVTESTTFAFICFGIMLNLGGLIFFYISNLLQQLVSYARGRALNLEFKVENILGEVLVAILAGSLGGFLTWLIAAKIFTDPANKDMVPYYVCFAAPAFLILFLLAATVFVGLASRFTTDADREWLARAGAWIIIASVAWSLISVVVIFGPGLLFYGIKTKIATLSLGTVSGLVTLVLGRSGKTSAKGKESSGASDIILMLAAPIFAAFILICLSLGTSWLIVELDGNAGSLSDLVRSEGLLNIIYHSPTMLLAGMSAAFLLIGLLFSLFININKFSLHAAYRDRLIRAYLGASRIEEERTPNPFTGLDENDNLQMQQLRTELFHEYNIDFGKLVLKLAENRDSKVSKYVFEQLSNRSKSLIEDYQSRPDDASQPPAVERDERRFALLNDLNLILQGESIYKKAGLSEIPEIQAGQKSGVDDAYLVSLRSEIAELLKQNPLVETLRLNRLLLELSYPQAGFAPAPTYKPMHIVNMTLNLVGGKKLAWQDRKAESFTVSALHSGSYCVGYRDSRIYGLNKDNQAISLGTAVAISGAAASPNMGYYSSTFVTFLLTLFNVRLGWWLGNPGRAGEWEGHSSAPYRSAGPNFAARPIIDEALGMTDDQHPYVYLSDGGHFENFGLYEMVLRRCKFIVVSDGSADPEYTYEGLGNAISKIRVDLGVPIDFVEQILLPKDTSGRSKDGAAGQNGEKKSGPKQYYCAIGRIGYSQVDKWKKHPEDAKKPEVEEAEDGLLLYIKASLGTTEPIDVYNYAWAHKDFPHQSTADQMYSESQFESYRMLGRHVLDQMTFKFTTQDGAAPGQTSQSPGDSSTAANTLEATDTSSGKASVDQKPEKTDCAQLTNPVGKFICDVWSTYLDNNPGWLDEWVNPKQAGPAKTEPEKTGPEKTGPEKTAPEKTEPEKK